MGDRANVYIREDEKHGVFFYTHWGGSELPETVRAALIRGKDRWTDHPYLARIIFNEMTRGNETELTGFGISARITDNEYPILVVDTDSMTVRFHKERRGNYDFKNDPPCKAFMDAPISVTKFKDYIKKPANWPKRNDD